MPTNHLKGIFFDAGNTLLRVHPSVGDIYAEAAKLYGAEVSAEAIEQAFKDLWNRAAPLVDNEGHRLTYEKERDWWKFLVREVFKDLIEFTDFDKFFDYLYKRFADSECWRLYDDVLEVLERLRARDCTMAIISNWDSRLPSLCQKLGISGYFQSTVVSSLVGYEKPHEAIFRIALEETGLTADQVLYVGDDPFLDYQAAKKAGMRALHLDRLDRFPDHPDRIKTLHELLIRAFDHHS